MSQSNRVRVGVAPATDSGRPLSAWLDDLRGRAVDAVDVDIRLLERALGAPEPAMPIEPPPIDGVAFGLLELEEEVLHDSYVLAAATLRSQTQKWRAGADVAALGPIRRAWETAGLAFGIVTVPDLTAWSDAEQDYACRLALFVGASIVSTRFSPSTPARLAPLARRHDVCISLVNDATTSVTDLARVATEDAPLAIALDLRAWTRNAQGPLQPFVDAHVDRISHVHLPEGVRVDDTAAAVVDDDNATVGDVLGALGRRTNDVPVIVVMT